MQSLRFMTKDKRDEKFMLNFRKTGYGRAVWTTEMDILFEIG